MSPLFFFSYARADLNSNPFLRKFYRELTAQIKLSETQEGFFDQENLQAGDIWDAKLKEALETSKTLIFVCSPSYLRSEYCGKEFQACLTRQQAVGGSSTALIPVIWGEPSDSLHSSIKAIQFKPRNVSDTYLEQGLANLMRLSKHRQAYKEFLIELARAVVAASRNHPLPQFHLPALSSIKSHFQSVNKGAGENRQAFFSYVVAQPHELPRSELRQYRDRGKDWRPFDPEDNSPVGLVAIGAAVRQNLYPQELEADSRLIDEIEEAEKQGDLVILLVDPWTVSVQRYRELMRQYDRINFENSAVLVVWNSPDAETTGKRTELEKALRTAFKNKAGQKSIYSDKIDSAQDLKATLARTLTKLRNKFIDAGRIQVPIEDAVLASAARANGIEFERLSIVSGPSGAGE